MKIDLSKWEKKTSPPHPDDDEHLIVGYSLGNAVLEHFTQYNCWELEISIGERLYIESGGCTPEDARDAAVMEIEKLEKKRPGFVFFMQEVE